MSNPLAALVNACLLIVLPVACCLAVIVTPFWLLPRRWAGPASALGWLLLAVWAIWLAASLSIPLMPNVR